MPRFARVCLVFAVLLACLAAPLSVAQPSEDTGRPVITNPPVEGEAPAALSSPRETVRQFLEAINAVNDGEIERWPDVLETLDLAGAEIEPDSNDARDRAEMLWQTLNRVVGFIDVETLPTGNGLIGRYRYTLFPKTGDATHDEILRQVELPADARIRLLPDEQGRWRFSAETVTAIPAMYAQVRTMPSAVDEEGELTDAPPAGLEHLSDSVVRPIVPDALRGEEHVMLSMEYWQWIGLFVLILLGVVVDYTLRFVVRTIAIGLIRRRGSTADRDSLRRMVRPIGLFVSAVVWQLLLPLLALPPGAHALLRGAVGIFLVLAGIWAAWRVIDLISEVVANQAKRTETKFDDVLIPLVTKAAKIFVVAIGVVYAAEALTIPLGPMLASLGLGSLAFAFAAKDTIENFFGSVAVILDRPFEVGDWIVIDGKTEGTVEELGFRSTRIRTFYNSQITVPNATLVRATVDNYGRRKYRRWKTHLGVQYDTPPDRLIAFTEGIRELVRTHPYTRKDYYQVWMHQWSASSMDILLYIFFEVPDWNTELRERERMFIDIVRLADRLGVQFAFPTQTVHLFKEEKPEAGAQHQPTHGVPGNSTDRRSMVHGLRAARAIVEKQSWLDNPPGPVQLATGPMAIELDEAGNETLVEKEHKTEPGAAAPPLEVIDEPPHIEPGPGEVGGEEREPRA
ncbi:MAG: mechanosensitive ion channel domain-containing protein [Phycisphaerales bacterium JB063]